MEPKKIAENTWEISKRGKMLVPAIIYASDALMEKISQDKTIQQATNVAYLPGIQKASYVMPDAHQGYGFAIGGVAAFDLDEGIVSPGGVGYDINCLTGDTKILDEFGGYKRLVDFEENAFDEEVTINNMIIKRLNVNIQTLNLENKHIEIKPAIAFMKKGKERVYEIILSSGLKIKATKEHPFLTKEGMIPAEFILNQEIAVNLFEGLPRQNNSEKELILAKLIGYLFGDGCLYFSNNKGYVVFYGQKEDLTDIQKDICRLGFNARIHTRTRNHKIKTQYGEKEFSSTNSELHVKTKEFVSLMKNAGVPEGNKTRMTYSVPEWIKKSPLSVKRQFLAAFFGAELSSPATHSKTGFYSPILSQNKIDALSSSARLFMLEIARLLEELGIKVNKISVREEFINRYKEKTKRFRLIISAEEDNLLKLWRNIGFEYNHKRNKLANISILYILLKKQENLKRKKLAEEIKQYRNMEFGISEVKKIYKNVINERFVERHYYENVNQRIALNFISFEDFKQQKLEEYDKFGAIFDKVCSITYYGKEEVYDFNVKDNHNFIANSFIVSNCGVRVLRTPFTANQIDKKRKELLDQLGRDVPAGVGRGGITKLTKDQLLEVLTKGGNWALNNNYGTKDDLKRTEEYGCMGNADVSACSEKAITRGMPQLGTLGAGNHFLEIQKVEEIYDKKIAKTFGIDKKDQILVMIHCGSRGFGHQTASDYIRLMEDKYGVENLPDRELINAPINSDLGQKYFKAMGCAINFAFANRQMIAHWTRQSFKKVMGSSDGMDMVYDVCHNIAKIEKHTVDRKKKDLCIHRKGATRAFGPGREEIPQVYRKVGQPVIIPGSMGTASYILVGSKEGEKLSWSSTAHGAGRVMSRSAALKQFRGEAVKKALEKQDIQIKAGSWKGLAEEGPQSYKDIDEVIRVSDKLKLAKKVVKVVPYAVMKG